MRIKIIIPTVVSKAELAPLTRAYRLQHIKVSFHTYTSKLPCTASLSELAEQQDALLLLYPGNRAPGTVANSLFVESMDKRRLPLGILPLKAGWQKAIQTAAKVQERKREQLSLALLGQRHPRYKKVNTRMASIAERRTTNTAVFQWTSDLVFREDLIRGLQAGIGLAIYTGHGRPSGWVGYYGMRAHHLAGNHEALGALISLCCNTSSRRRVGTSFAEQVVLNGCAASCLGAIKPTLHTQNTRWAVELIENLMQSSAQLRIGELLLKACPINPEGFKYYRLIGDPLAPLQSSKIAFQNAQKIKTYA